MWEGRCEKSSGRRTIRLPTYSVSGMALAYYVNVPVSKILAGALLTFLAAKPSAAQFPRLAPPPACMTTYTAPALLSYWTGSNRDNRPKVAVFSLQPDVDDAGRVYLSI